MSRIDTLAVDHRAVLLLVLREGHSYGALADRLGIPEDAVRGRAHAALDALGADVSPAPDAARRALLADHLLGRHDESGRVAARRLLDEDAAARAWACAVAAPLREIGGDRVPEIPSAASPARARTGARRPAIPLVIAGVAAAAAAVAVVLVLRDGGSGGNAATTAAPPDPAAAAGRTVVEAQAALVPPAARPRRGAVGVVLVTRGQRVRRIAAAVQGLPRPRRGRYGVWLYAGPRRARWLGLLGPRDRRGRQVGRGVLSGTITGFREVLVTREARGDPARPGPVVLRGALRAPGRG